uniref:Uncharacterized protein n=1 Tax=Pelusios castaneus TaxID=367368 RepID=A0A8C8RSH0_9SAUR
MDAPGQESDWRSANFRQKLVSQIRKVSTDVSQGNCLATFLNPYPSCSPSCFICWDLHGVSCLNLGYKLLRAGNGFACTANGV